MLSGNGLDITLDKPIGMGSMVAIDLANTRENNRLVRTADEKSNWQRLNARDLRPVPQRIIAKSGSIYQVARVLGKGGMGVVLLAHRLHDNLAVAVKIAASAENLEAQDIIRREGKALLQLKHKNIVRLIEAGDTDCGEPFLAMQYVEGESLQQILRRESCLDLQRAKEICLQVAEAMAFAHKAGVLHRDLKPANIMISRFDGRDRVTLIDFGISQLQSTKESEDTHLTSGSLLYMSPEQVHRDPYSTRSDVYQLALVLFECLTGRLPFEPSIQDAVLYRLSGSIFPSDCQAISHLPAALLVLLQKSLDRKSSTRLESMTAFHNELGRSGEKLWAAA